MKKYILAGVMIGISLFSYGCGHQEYNMAEGSVSYSVGEESESAASTSAEDEVIVFKSAAIEEKTCEILKKPKNTITKNDVLAITEFEMDDECAAPFEDLQWFQNLERIRLHGCGVQSLNGVEKLTKLKYLWVRDNDITDIEPIRNMTSLEEFSCARNPISDYSPLSGLTGLKELQIGDNGYSYTDITVVSNLKNLTSLYAPWCGIDDISALKNLTELEYLNLFHNQIEDISALEKHGKITRLYLGMNLISDVTPLRGLDVVTHLDLRDNSISDITPLYDLNAMAELVLHGNMISEEELADFYDKKSSETYFTVTQKGRLREDMPEFTFDLNAYWQMRSGRYALQSVEIRDGDTTLQTISIPELTLFGQTAIYDSMGDTLGLELEDVNFDGYLDIRQYDTDNGNYRQEWIYLVWNPAEYRFEYDARLNEISLATFDQDKELIYGMERGGADRHYFSTYQYIDGEPVKISYTAEEGIMLDDDKTKEFCVAASGNEEAANYVGDWFYIHLMERNEATGELETVSEEYVFDYYNENGDYEELSVDVSSELGQQITQARK